MVMSIFYSTAILYIPETKCLPVTALYKLSLVTKRVVCADKLRIFYIYL